MPDTFSYTDFKLSPDKKTASFTYSLQHNGKTYPLTETLTFPVALKETKEQFMSLRALHLALGISYYKIFVNHTTKHPYQMDKSEADFWNTVFRNGLSEFLYMNNLSPDSLATFQAQDGESYDNLPVKRPAYRRIALLGLGGGKDSIVAGESLRGIGVQTEGFVMATGEQLGQTQAVAKEMHIPLHVIERHIDQSLLTLQEQPGAYKGHIPISLIFGLVGTVLAIAQHNSYIVVANEASASIPRITWEHGTVNHQWSKSFELERQLQAFIHTSMTAKVTYFSAIRQLTSVGVAKLFAAYPKYFKIFTSDNTVFRVDPSKRPNGRWSLESPKSLSSFILLSAWLTEADLLDAFGLNFLDQPNLETLFLEMLGEEGEPPLDCVGTPEELLLSLNLAAQQGKFTSSYLVQLARERGIIEEKNWNGELLPMLTLQPDEALPKAISRPLQQVLRAELLV